MHIQKKKVKKLIKDQEKLEKEGSAKFDAKHLANYQERLDIVEKLIDNEEQANALRSEHVEEPRGDKERGMDEKRHVIDKMNDLGRSKLDALNG